MTIELFGLNDQFTQQEAFELLNSHVVKKEDQKTKDLSIEFIGFIAGVLTLNDEVEVMIKFRNEIMQLNKRSFIEKITLIEMP